MKTIIVGHLPIFRGTCHFCNAALIVEPDDEEYNEQINPNTNDPIIMVTCSTPKCKRTVYLHKDIDPQYLYKSSFQYKEPICLACIEGDHLEHLPSCKKK